MPKRRSENTVEFLAKKLKKFENELKRCRLRGRRRLPSNTSSSSSSSCSSRSTSGSRSASRNSSLSEKSYDRLAKEPTRMPQCDDIGAQAQPPAAEPVDAATASAASPESCVPPAPAQVTTVTEAAALPVAPTDPIENPLDPEILEILGADPTAIQKYGPDINKDLANRFNHITTAGLDKENRKALIEKYLIPGNCSKIAAPRLNPEIKAALPDTVTRRDKAIEARQTEIAAAISCLSQAISSQLTDKNTNHCLLKQLMDSARILCDIQYSESVSRRNFALYSLKKDVKEQLTNTKIDTLLFGENLPETLKTAKAVSKTSSDLKIDAGKKTNPPKYSSSKPLNWKAGPSNRKAAAGPGRRQPPAAASSQPPPASSSRNSSRPQRSRPARPRH